MSGRAIPDADVASMIEDNLAAACSVFDGAVDGDWPAPSDVSLTFPPETPHPRFNGVYRTRARAATIDARISELSGAYGSHRLPMSWSVGPRDRPRNLPTRLEEHGFQQAVVLIPMAADLADIPPVAHDPESVVQRVADLSALDDVARTVAEGFSLPTTAALGLVNAFRPHLADPSAHRHYAARVDGQVVATSTLTLTAGVAGLWWVSTLAHARKRGLGASVTLTALHAAREDGCRTGVLLASPMAVSMYRRLGFHEYGTRALYVREATSAAVQLS